MRENDKLINSEPAVYRRFIGRAVAYRDAAREFDIDEEIRKRRLDMMRFYARLALIGGVRGSIYK